MWNSHRQCAHSNFGRVAHVRGKSFGDVPHDHGIQICAWLKKKLKKIGHVGEQRDIATSRTTTKFTFVPDKKICDVLLYF